MATEKLYRLLPEARGRIYLDFHPAVHDSPRHFGRTYPHMDGTATVVVAPALASLPYQAIVGVLLHELGHVLVFMLGLGEPKGYDARERQADNVAEQLYGLPIGYVEGVQFIGAGIRPRPAGLR
jgi:hypothetical protein